MSKINSDFMKRTISELLNPVNKDGKPEKKRGFVETVELQIGIRDYDPEKDKRFSGSIRLPHCPHPKQKIVLIGTAAHIEEAKKHDIPYIDVDGLKKFNKERKAIKSWAKPYGTIICSESLMKQVPKLLGNVLVKIGKFPLSVGESESVNEKVKELKHTVRFQLKKVLNMATSVGDVKMNPEDLRQNINMCINFFVSLLKKGWQNVKTLHLHTTMGKSYRVYG